MSKMNEIENVNAILDNPEIVVEQVEPETVAETVPVVDLKVERDALLEQAKSLGIKVHPAIGIPKLKEKIQEKILSNESNQTPITPVETKSDKSEVILTGADSTTYAKVNSIDELNAIRAKMKAQIQEIEKTELKNPTWEQKKELSDRIGKLNQHIRWATNRTIDIKQKKQQEIKSVGISKKVYKQSKLVAMIREGKSLSVIVSEPEGISKDEIQELLSDDIILECAKHRPDFVEYYKRWKDKYLTSK
jgi:hypothetical protein